MGYLGREWLRAALIVFAVVLLGWQLLYREDVIGRIAKGFGEAVPADDVNAALNRLVGEGLIAGYRTNLIDREKPERLEVTVTPGSDRMWNLEDQIRRALPDHHHNVFISLER